MDTFSEENLILAECLSKCAQGDHKAFEQIFTLTSGKLNAILCGMVQDETLAHDILQHAYISIWKNSASYDPSKGKAFTWILVITRNRAIDQLRKLKRRPDTTELIETLPDKTAKSDSAAKSMLLKRFLDPHLDNLPPDMSRAIMLNIVHGLSSREIAETIGVSPNTVKSWIRRGLKKLRSQINMSDLNALL